MLAAVASAGAAGNKDLANEIFDTWNQLVAISYTTENSESVAMNENKMREEYEKVKKLTPRFKIDKKKQKISIEGLK